MPTWCHSDAPGRAVRCGHGADASQTCHLRGPRSVAGAHDRADRRCELIGIPRPASGHASVTSELGYELTGPFGRGKGGPGGWVIRDEPELHLGSDVLVPDLAGWKKERYGAPQANQKWFATAPDWVCEVLSPSTASLDKISKSRVYLRSGVKWQWFIDPLGRILEAFRSDGQRWDLIGTWASTDRPRIEPFDAIELDLPALWADIGPGDE